MTRKPVWFERCDAFVHATTLTDPRMVAASTSLNLRHLRLMVNEPPDIILRRYKLTRPMARAYLAFHNAKYRERTRERV